MKNSRLPRERRRPVVALGGAVLFAILSSAPVSYAQQRPNGGAVEVLPVQGNVYLLAGAGGNITFQVGEQGVLVVDTGSEQMSAEVIAAIRAVTKKPIRYLVNTQIDSDHTGGNVGLRQAGMTVSGSLFESNSLDAIAGATIIAHENVFNRMSGLEGEESAPAEALPEYTYFGDDPKKLFFNDEGIAIWHVPAAHTDGDSIVFFRRSDVVVAGDIFVTTRYPVIDRQRGGSIQGIVAGLNRILELTIADQDVEGGTYVVPGHGRIGDQFDILEYRDMMVIIRDRVQDMISQGMTVEQVKAARPTADYDARYGADTGSWTTAMFVEAVYESLGGQSQ